VARPPQHGHPMRYQNRGGQIYAGLVRVTWELNSVRLGKGGTSFLSGSHKLHEPYGGPDAHRPNVHGSPWQEEIHDAMETYACPCRQRGGLE
jgi:hypothetical protein